MASLPKTGTVTYEEWLRMPVVECGREEVVNGEMIRREPLTRRSPDAAVFERATMVEEDGSYLSAPQLALEVLSPSETRKEIAEKLRDYESIGAEEVWLVNPEAATVEVLQLENGSLQRAAIWAEGILKPRHFPAVQVDIARIWPD